MSVTLSTSADPLILLVGLDPATYPFPSEQLRTRVQAAIEEMNAVASQANLKLHECDLRKGSEVADLLSSLKSNKYDGVVLGAGIRTFPTTVPLLEQIVHVIHKEAPDAIVMFNSVDMQTPRLVAHCTHHKLRISLHSAVSPRHSYPSSLPPSHAASQDPVDSLTCIKRWFPAIPNFNPAPSTFHKQ